MFTIGIIGNGFVGKATFQLQCKNINILASMMKKSKVSKM